MGRGREGCRAGGIFEFTSKLGFLESPCSRYSGMRVKLTGMLKTVLDGVEIQ